MIILALDTTGTLASLAIRADSQTVAGITIESNDGFAHLIFPAIEKLRNEANLPLDQIDCFAAASGPGSFTGVRVGLAAVKGLAEATGKPALGVSNLRALSSFGKKSSFGKNRALRAVALDARRSELYAAVYDSELRPVTPEAVLPFAAWLETLDPEAAYEFISPVKLPLEGTPFAAMPFTAPPGTLAAAVALCAEYDGLQGKWQDPAALDANYVRHSDAELSWKDRS